MIDVTNAYGVPPERLGNLPSSVVISQAFPGAAHQALEQRYPIAGSGSGVWFWVHVEDAAAATVAALECPAGVYNVVDGDPSAMSVWLSAFAASVGAPEPQHINEREALEQAGLDAVYYATQLRGASNAKAKRDLAFAPRRLEWLTDPSSFTISHCCQLASCFLRKRAKTKRVSST